MKSRVLYIVSLSVMYTAPLYALAGMLVIDNTNPSWAVAAPMIFLYMPATFYLLQYKCRTCNKVVLTPEVMKAHEWKKWYLPLAKVSSCPHCGAPL